MSWGYLCSLDLPTYPSLVREFYASIARGFGGFHCKLRGINIIVNEELLCRFLKMSSDGGIGTVHSNREGALKLIFNRVDVNPLDDILVSQLSVKMRLLPSIISRILFPKTGCFDFFFERDLVLMHFIIEEIPINLPRLMMNCMCEAASKAKASLPYGMVIT